MTFQKRRQLKKAKQKSRFKFLIIILLFLLPAVLIAEYFYLNYTFGTKNLVSPIAKAKVSKVADLEKALEKKDISFSSVSVNSDGSYSVKLQAGGVVILSSKKDIKSQLSSLQLILSRLTIEGKKLRNLDLRFGSPVISF